MKKRLMKKAMKKMDIGELFQCLAYGGKRWSTLADEEFDRRAFGSTK